MLQQPLENGPLLKVKHISRKQLVSSTEGFALTHPGEDVTELQGLVAKKVNWADAWRRFMDFFRENIDLRQAFAFHKESLLPG